MRVRFECVVCGDTAFATVAESAPRSGDKRLETLRDCPTCGIETIWVESRSDTGESAAPQRSQ